MVSLELNKFWIKQNFGTCSSHKIWCPCVYVSVYLFILCSSASWGLILHLSASHLQGPAQHLLGDCWCRNSDWQEEVRKKCSLRSHQGVGCRAGLRQRGGLASGSGAGAQVGPALPNAFSIWNHSLSLGLSSNQTSRTFPFLSILLSFLWF